MAVARRFHEFIAKPLKTRTRVVLLGTGTPNADPDRWGPAVAVVASDAKCHSALVAMPQQRRLLPPLLTRQTGLWTPAPSSPPQS